MEEDDVVIGTCDDEEPVASVATEADPTPATHSHTGAHSSAVGEYSLIL
jgi:hypothetical protein